VADLAKSFLFTAAWWQSCCLEPQNITTASYKINSLLAVQEKVKEKSKRAVFPNSKW
jgi:hypothetical protein